MGQRIALVEHDRPRVIALDFSDSDVRKFCALGYNVRKAESGLFNRGKFSIPWAVQDVEIIIGNVAKDTFSQLRDRTPDDASVERDVSSFGTILRETWLKDGCVVFFLKPDCNPSEFAAIGIDHLGVIARGRQYYPKTAAQEFLSSLATVSKQTTPYPIMFPAFKGDGVISNLDDVEQKLLAPFLKVAKYSILTTGNQIGELWRRYVSSTNLIQDESSNQNALAIKLQHFDGMHYGGQVLFLPDFGKNNIEVGIKFVQEVFANQNPYLFDSGHHPWLENYLPHSVQQTREKKAQVVAVAKEQLSNLEKEESDLLQEYNWLLGLLTSPGDEFRDHVAKALEFLGFEILIIDDLIPPGQAKKEDLYVRDLGTGFLAIGETKSTKRGASEGFLSDVQNHQGRFSREKAVPIPSALLIVNHSTALDPSKRLGRFYQNRDLNERCRQQGITAIDSVALFDMCQGVMEGTTTADQIRLYIEREHRIITDYKPVSQ